MKHIPLIAAAMLAGIAMLSSAPAMARVDVDVNVGIPGTYLNPPLPSPPRYVPPGPVYVQPGPVYVQPGPVYVPPGPVYVQPRPMYRDDWRERRWHDHGRRWDWDGDGVPNRYDRRPNDPWRR